MIEQHSYSGDYTNRYKFNGKELDEETGFYYYGARYYNPKFSIWLSVDPLAEKYPSFNPYNYTMQNPINLIDPDGQAPMDWYKNNYTGKVIWRNGQHMLYGYKNLGHTSGHTDVNGNRTLLDGDTKQITYNGKVLADFNKSPNSSYGGYVLSDGPENAKNSEYLRKGGKNADWIDFGGVLGWIDFLLGKEPGKMTKLNPKGKGTNGGGPTIDNKASDAIDAVNSGTSLTKTTIEEANKAANTEKEKTKNSKQSEYIYTKYDRNNSNNNVRVRREDYEAQQKKKNESK